MKLISKLIILLFLVEVLSGCSDMIVTEPNEANNIADFDAAWQTVKLVYPFFEFKKIDWDTIRTIYRPRAETARGDEINGVIIDMLKVLRDGHVGFQTQGGAYVSTYTPPRVDKDRYAYSPLVVRRYFDKELRVASGRQVEYEILSGNIGYIYVASLQYQLPVLNDFDEALMYVKGTKGLIIDVRGNGGGSDLNSQGIVGRLIASPIDNFPYPIPGAGLHEGPLISPRGPFQYLAPVVMLINGTCFSSCEDFAEMMKHVPTVTAVGDTTAGASGAPQLYTLPSGKEIRVSTIEILRYNGQPIEWNGVPPDIRVPQTQADIKQGKDRQLEYAIQLLE